jgi:hypothetical protein
MTLPMVIGAVGILVFAMVFIAGLQLVRSYDEDS